MRAVFGLLVFAAGCHHSYADTTRLIHEEAVRCATAQAAIVQACGEAQTPNAECRAKIEVERTQCRATLEEICKNGRGCP